MLLNAQNLTIGYEKANPLLSNINFTLKAGCFVGLFGANGTGKSTLLKTLSGFISPLAGQLTMNEQPLDSYKAAERAKKIAIVLTERISTPYLSAGEVVKMGRMPHTSWAHALSQHDLKLVAEAVKQVGIEHLVSQEIRKLSDGEYQKTMIARALAQDCPVLLLDEPTAFLDIQQKQNVLTLLGNIVQNTQKSVVVCTHDILFCVQFCTEIWLVDSHKQFRRLLNDGTISAEQIIAQICGI